MTCKYQEMGYIYILTSPSGKLYIGQTTRPIHARLEEHRKGNSDNCRLIFRAINKYGWDVFDIDWYYCPDEDLNKHEELMEEVLGTLAPSGYNLMKGGGNRGKRSEETRQKMSEAHLGEKNHNFGIPRSEETRQKIGKAKQGEKNPNFGKTPSEETSLKHSESTKGEKNHKSKRIYQYDLDGTFIDSFGSTEEAGRHLKKTTGTKISACARGERKTAYKFKWSYDMK